MFFTLIHSILFLSSHLAFAYEDARHLFCDNSTTYASNSAFSASLGQALDFLRNNTAPTGFSTTTVGNQIQPVTALALCRATISPSDCQTCIDAATSGIRRECPDQTVAQIWYTLCMIRYSQNNFINKPDNMVVLIIYDERQAPNPDADKERAKILMQELSSTAGASDKRFAIGRTSLSSNQTIYGYVDCNRDLSGEDCTNCLLYTTNFSCCLGQRGGWIATQTCSIQFNMDPVHDDLLTAPQINTVTPPARRQGGSRRRGLVIGISVGAAGTVILVAGLLWVALKVRKRRTVERVRGRIVKDNAKETMLIGEDIGMKCTLYDLDELVAATDNFSSGNRLGGGGFGPVYKGIMPSGQEIAVKKLASGSMQGIEEFKNEVRLLLKMQHRNLVRLIGCCVQEERMLVYEYLPNKSLDYFLFDKSKSTLLDWPKRYNIIMGVARGLLYLHEDSKLKIVHRDIKASNVLLDEQMSPKISDFGLAKLFNEQQSHIRTQRIAGTFGYMAPEYAIQGLMSAKSDVFSFGVLMLEIISGRKNYDMQFDEERQGLLNHTWRLEQGGRLTELVDVTMGSFPQEHVVKCIRVGLLCCQELTQDRPTMSSALQMLSNNSATITLTGQPGYTGRRDYTHALDTSEGALINPRDKSSSSDNFITSSLTSGR